MQPGSHRWGTRWCARRISPQFLTERPQLKKSAGLRRLLALPLVVILCYALSHTIHSPRLELPPRLGAVPLTHRAADEFFHQGRYLPGLDRWRQKLRRFMLASGRMLSIS
jgi:hypothetical protein